MKSLARLVVVAGSQPVKTPELLGRLDIRVLLEDGLESMSRRCRQSFRPGRGVPHGAGPAHLVEQPLGAELGVLDLLLYRFQVFGSVT